MNGKSNESHPGDITAKTTGVSSPTLPDSLPRETILEAIRLFEDGFEHRFADSTGYDLVFQQHRYPPKAIVGIAAQLLTGGKYGPDSFSGGLRSKCFRLLEAAGFTIAPKVSVGGWLFQGNPDRYDIDAYISFQDFVYWSAPRQAREMHVDDRCILWRSGPKAGAVAVGRIAELPRKTEELQFPSLLGEAYWQGTPDDSGQTKVGIEIKERRIDLDDGFVPRTLFLADPILQGSRIIRMPTGTVFKMTPEEMAAFSDLWGRPIDHRPGEAVEADEGRRVLRQHYARERNRSLVRLKRMDFASRNNGRVFCEICQFEYGEHYPRPLGDGFIEVHHLQPLSRSSDQRQTSLTDLLLVCANCHRMIHRTQDVEGNLAALQQHFAASH